MAVEIIYGEHTYGKIKPIGHNSGRILVGKYCSIAGEVKAFMADDHNMNNISTFPFGHLAMPISKLMKKSPLPTAQHYRIRKSRSSITIGNDVWVGMGAIIFRGVYIGDGVCIGAFSVVTKDISPYSVVVGHSRVVRKRFPQEDIDFLLALKWWDFDDQTVADIVPMLHNPDVGILRKWAEEHEKV